MSCCSSAFGVGFRCLLAVNLLGLALAVSCGNRLANVNGGWQNVTVSSPGPTPPRTANSAPTPEPVVQINKDPKTLVLAFYEFYVDGFPNINDDRLTFSRYLSSRFFDQAVKAEDFDIFLDAQDFDETWKGNVSVADATVTGSKATVVVSLNGETFKWKRKVSLVKKGSVWQIDGVKSVD